jgi:hypothetical protein
MANEYQGNSIVDYLKSIGKDASYQARATLASQHGITNYTGSAEQNLQLLNKLKTTTTPTSPIPTSTTPTQQQQDLAKVLAEVQKRQAAGTFTPTTDQSALIQRAQSTLPSSVTNVNQLGTTPTLPADATSTTYPQVNIIDATSVSDYIQKQQEKLEAERATAQAALSKAGLTGTGTSLQEQLFTGYQKSAPIADYGKALTTAEDKYGVTESLAEVKLQSEKVAQMKKAIENLDLQRQNELDVANTRLASMTSIQAEKNAINERYDSQRVKLVGDYNIEAAILAAKSNNLSEANNLVQYAVQAYTADITAEINRFNNLYSLASDWIDSLDAQEKSILDDAKAELERERDLETTRLNNVLNLKLQYPNAGINPTDTLEQANQKAEDWTKKNPTISQILGSAETGYTMYDKYGNVIGTKSGVDETKDNPTIFDSLMQGVIDAGGDIYGAVEAANELAQFQYGRSLSISEMNNLLSIASSMTPIETQPTQEQSEPTNAIDISKVTGEKTFGIGPAPKKTMGIGSYGTSLQANNINIPKQETRSAGIGAPDTTSWFYQLFNE